MAGKGSNGNEIEVWGVLSGGASTLHYIFDNMRNALTDVEKTTPPESRRIAPYRISKTVTFVHFFFSPIHEVEKRNIAPNELTESALR